MEAASRSLNLRSTNGADGLKLPVFGLTDVQVTEGSLQLTVDKMIHDKAWNGRGYVHTVQCLYIRNNRVSYIH